MEPQGRPLTPGTSYGPPAFSSAQTLLSCTSQSSTSPSVSDGPMSARCSWAHAADETHTEGPDLDRGAQRRFRSSAFPSSLSWDSDSEKEALDEEELQHFSNPHGLAAHSPGSPSSGIRLDSEEDPEKLHLQSHTDPPLEPSTEDGNTCQRGPTQVADSKVWSVSEGAELLPSNVKPKESCQMEGAVDHSEEEKRPKGKESRAPERDVYTFPGDSDPESPPPAPWAQCTFIQRCKKKRVLLRPFSGLGTTKRALPETGKRARVSPEISKTAEMAQLSRGGGVYDFEEVSFGEEEPIKFRHTEEETEPDKEIFTCVECSIYFKKQVHLQEHMVEHCQSAAAGRKRSGKSGRFRCIECGWNLPSRLALADHHKKHQESRLKILEEIEKLNENKNPSQKLDCTGPDRDASPGSNPGKVSEPEIVTSPPLSPAPVSTPEAESDTTPPSSGRPPAQARAGSTYRRRFVCNKCNFSARTPQALANHSQTHNKKKTSLQVDFPPRGSPSRSPSTSLSCGHCAFLTSSQTVLREHQKLVHPAEVSVCGAQVDEPGPHSRSNVGTPISKPILDPDDLSESGSLPDAAPGQSQQQVTASGESTTPDHTAAQPADQRAFNRRFSRRGKTWMEPDRFHPRLDDDKLPGSEEEEEEQDEDPSTELAAELSKEDTNSPGGVRPHTRARSNTDESSAQTATLSLPSKKKDEHKREVQKDGKVFFLRRRTRVTAASAESDSEEDDVDKERVRRVLSQGALDDDKDDIDEDAEALKSVERKCPYCPDRFHNGIGLANHVRGHLNRVGVSYNVRHFISPEEVNAIEKKFSYQKKKKKGESEEVQFSCVDQECLLDQSQPIVAASADMLPRVTDFANFDPDTFSVMHCEFCSAGFDTRAGLSSHARAHLRDFGITNWDVTISPIHILRELFSSRPDLVIPTAPPRSSGSPLEDEEEEDDEEDNEDEDDDEDEGEGMIEVKLEGETSERTLCADVSDALPSASPPRWREEEEDGGDEGDEEEAAGEEDEDELQLHPLDDLSSSPGGKTGLCSEDTDGLSPRDEADAKVHSLKCEVCGAQFETRRGLSSHARSHLRQLGIRVSESSGAPIDLLYQIAKERSIDGQISSSLLEPLLAKNSSLAAPQMDEELEDMDLDEKPITFSILAKAAKAVPPSSSSTPSPGASPAPPHPASPSSVVRKAPISSLLPVSSPLRSSEHRPGGMKSLTSNLAAPAAMATTKPLWAPQDSDAPLNLALDVDPNKDIVCQLCGAWFETRKGLSSHARAHLRHFGVEYSESKGSPIDLLNQLIDTDDFKHKASSLQLDGHTEPRGLGTNTPSPKQSLLSLSSSSTPSLLYKVTTSGGGSTSKATSSSGTSLLGPPAKRLKSSSMQVFRLSSGELMALPHNEPPKEIGCEFCGEYFENRKGLSSHARSHLRQMGITEWSVNGSPIDTLRDIITRRGLPCALPLKPLKTPPPSSPGPPHSPLSTSSSPPAPLLNRLPFAFARPSSPPQPASSKSSSAASGSGLILKLKPEPVQLEVTTQGALGRSGGFSGEALNCSWSSSDNVFPLNLAMAHEVEPTRDIRCEFCGEYFENRKGLSSHARSHLRQMGITEWSVNGSPIDTLREVMRKRGLGPSSLSDRGVKKESNQGASSPPWESTTGAGTSERLRVSGYQASKFRKSPLSLLQSGTRLHKQGLGSGGPSSAPPARKIFRMSPLGKRPLLEEAHSVETSHSSPHRLKNFSPLPHDFSFKRKASPDKPGHQDPSCELCGFYFENRKALASHARAHLRQFGVTEWCVNGSPIETLSAWMRSRPQKVLEMHRSYMQGNRSTLKKKGSSPLTASADSDHILPVSSQKTSSSSSSSSQWSSSLAVSLVRPLSREVGHGSSKAAESEAGSNRQASAMGPGRSSPSLSRLAGGLPLQAQVARSELNVRLPRGFERRPLKHPSCPDGTERDPPKPPRTGTVPSLVPKPPSYPLVKLVGKFYTLKCRFCEVEFHGPLSVQEDWIRHLQQHILKMNYNKPAAPKGASSEPPASADEPAPVQASAPASTSTSSTTSSTASTTPALTSTPTRSPTPPAECAPAVTATEIAKVSEELPPPAPLPLPTQTA
ncbi:Protein Wiz Widely-interspaced zinc finger-containing protein [Channa argus]|uniref:Protein Wiz Widely-interspaced zinc finger-containing protein n=1 Tax=Channa argus TaxID=215402 RepID=A0A6G1QDU6_CHAAH|nr:Protein Wiz Widely-interspaced zinc finger-containing protein [Channa argus]